MDISDLIRLIEKLFPVLIFLIWIFFTVVANSRKKGPLGKPIPPAERPTYGESQAPQKTDESGSSQIGDDLRRTLETIFGENRSMEKETPDSERYEQHEESEPKAEPVKKDSESVEVQTSRESAMLEEQAEIQRKFDSIQKSSTQAVPVAPLMQPIEEIYESTEITISRDELRKGIIWAEIIGPPVSMRS